MATPPLDHIQAQLFKLDCKIESEKTLDRMDFETAQYIFTFLFPLVIPESDFCENLFRFVSERQKEKEAYAEKGVSKLVQEGEENAYRTVFMRLVGDQLRHMGCGAGSRLNHDGERFVFRQNCLRAISFLLEGVRKKYRKGKETPKKGTKPKTFTRVTPNVTESPTSSQASPSSDVHRLDLQPDVPIEEIDVSKPKMKKPSVLKRQKVTPKVTAPRYPRSKTTPLAAQATIPVRKKPISHTAPAASRMEISTVSETPSSRLSRENEEISLNSIMMDERKRAAIEIENGELIEMNKQLRQDLASLDELYRNLVDGDAKENPDTRRVRLLKMQNYQLQRHVNLMNETINANFDAYTGTSNAVDSAKGTLRGILNTLERGEGTNESSLKKISSKLRSLLKELDEVSAVEREAKRRHATTAATLYYVPGAAGSGVLGPPGVRGRGSPLHNSRFPIDSVCGTVTKDKEDIIDIASLHEIDEQIASFSKSLISIRHALTFASDTIQFSSKLPARTDYVNEIEKTMRTADSLGKRLSRLCILVPQSKRKQERQIDSISDLDSQDWQQFRARLLKEIPSVLQNVPPASKKSCFIKIAKWVLDRVGHRRHVWMLQKKAAQDESDFYRSIRREMLKSAMSVIAQSEAEKRVTSLDENTSQIKWSASVGKELSELYESVVMVTDLEERQSRLQKLLDTLRVRAPELASIGKSAKGSNQNRVEIYKEKIEMLDKELKERMDRYEEEEEEEIEDERVLGSNPPFMEKL